MELSFEGPDLVLPVEQLSLHIVLFARCHTHRVLDVAELYTLSRLVVLHGSKLFRLLVQLSMRVVERHIHLLNVVFEVHDDLVF
jgi:hypothetical protein